MFFNTTFEKQGYVWVHYYERRKSTEYNISDEQIGKISEIFELQVSKKVKQHRFNIGKKYKRLCIYLWICSLVAKISNKPNATPSPVEKESSKWLWESRTHVPSTSTAALQEVEFGTCPGFMSWFGSIDLEPSPHFKVLIIDKAQEFFIY